MNKLPIAVALSAIDPLDLYRVGDCPNKEMKTMGGKKFWNDLKCCENGWKLQQNKITRLCRILDENNVRKAWGNRFAMQEKLKRLTREDFLEVGDVIGIDRAGGVYEHYAVYIGEGRVIHYQGEGQDFKGAITIREAPFADFLKNNKQYFVLLFDTERKNVIKLHSGTEFISAEVLDNHIFTHKNFCLYTPEETVQRARERLGEEKYHLVVENCEHMAIWCKTGVSFSFQVLRVLDWMQILRYAHRHKTPFV